MYQQPGPGTREHRLSVEGYLLLPIMTWKLIGRFGVDIFERITQDIEWRMLRNLFSFQWRDTVN